jgi:hypothetical protein
MRLGYSTDISLLFPSYYFSMYIIVDVSGWAAVLMATST